MSDASNDAPPVSLTCGDGIRDPVLEECDDGPGVLEDACTPDCRAHNYFVVPPTLIDGGTKQGSRTLGFGRHPCVAAATGAAVAFVEKVGSVHSLRVAFFDSLGRRLGGSNDLGAGATPAEHAHPVMAALPGGVFALAWNDLTGGSLDVGLRIAQPGTAPGPVAYANQAKPGAQRDPDLIWTGTELVAAWSDGASPKLRRFDSALAPIDGETQLDPNGPPGGSVALEPFNNTWVAAWRSIDPSGLEVVNARAGSVTWKTGPFVPGAPQERPAVLALDATHVLVVFTEGTDPLTTGTAGVPRLRAAILDVAAPGVVPMIELQSTVAPWAIDPTLGQSRPSIARAGSRRYLAWQNESPVGNPLEDEVWLRELTWDGVSLGLLAEHPLQADAPRAGAQRAPALASSPLGPSGALVTVWEDATIDPLHDMLPDLVFGLRPTPIVVLPTDGGGA